MVELNINNNNTGRKITLEVGGHESVENLRDKLEPFVGVKIEEMKFFYNGQQVLIGHPFLEYSIFITKIKKS